MRNWFPLTDYEFYAYLISGALVVAAGDYSLGYGYLVFRAEWSAIEIVAWSTVAYLVGQLLAAPAASFVEHVLARKVLTPPQRVQLGEHSRNLPERLFAAVFAPREYSPLSPVRIEMVKARALSVAGRPLNAEETFQLAFARVRSVKDVSSRIDAFQNQYSFGRNVSMASGLAAGLLSWKWASNPGPHDRLLVCVAVVLCVGMFGRFVKFYGAYSAEVFRLFTAD